MSVSGLKGRRKTKTRSDKGPESKKPRVESEFKSFAVTYFEQLLEDAGLKIGEVESNHVLSCEPLKFCEKLKTVFENNDSFPRNVSEFAKGFEERCQDDDELDSFFVRNIIIETESGEETRSIRPSIFRLLLGISCLQEDLIQVAVDKATQFAIDDKPDKVQMMLRPFVLLPNLSAVSKLAKGLICLLEVGSHAVRLEIIVSLPDMITKTEHQNIASELCRFMTEDYELTPAILDCLNNFCLPAHIKIEVRDKMLSALRTTAPHNIFPNLVTFFLVTCATECNSEVIEAMREGLDWTTIGSQPADGSSQIMTALSLKAAFRTSKNLAKDWIKVIQGIKSANEHKPLDIIVLLILYSLKNGKEKIIENTFCKRIKLGLFTNSLTNIIVEKFKSIIQEFLKDVTQLIFSLLQVKFEPSVKEFSVHWLVMIFTKIKDSRRIIINDLLPELLEEKDNLSNSLMILSKIANENIEMLKPFSLQMMSLVGNIHVLNSSEMSQAMNLLCGLAFSIENSILHDDVHMFICKQISSSDMNIKIRGVIGAIMAVKHMINSNLCESIQSDTEYSDINNLPEGKAKEAALIVELILKSINEYPDVICYFNDEFAKMLSDCKDVDPIFLSWLTDKINTTFQSKFISDFNPSMVQSIHGISLSCQFCVNDSEEVEEQIVLNIANSVLSGNPDSKHLRTLPSLFHLLQVLCKKGNGGDLFSIGALLGCGIIMPVVNDENSLGEFNPEYIDKIIFCFVYCINWFRELLSAFCGQQDEQIKKKMLLRLNNLIFVERRLGNFLHNDKIDFKPPISTINDFSDLPCNLLVNREFKIKKAPKRAVSKKKNTPNDPETSLPNETLKSQDASMAMVRSNQSTSNCKLNSAYLRPINFDTIKILNKTFIVEELNDSVENLNGTLNVDSLLFLLSEINSIIYNSLPARSVSTHHFTKPVKQSSSISDSAKIINTCIEAIPMLLNYLETLKEHTKKKLEDNDDVRDAPGLFTEEISKIQMCLASLFQMITTILSWFGLHLPENKQILIRCYNLLITKCESNEKTKYPLKTLIRKSCTYFSEYNESCIFIATAASLIKLLQSMTIPTEDKQVIDILIETSSKMLAYSWRDSFGNAEKGLIFNQHINTLLGGYFFKPNIEAIKTLSLDLLDQCSEPMTKNRVLNNFQCINKANFPLLFRAVYQALYESAKNEIDGGLTDKQHLDLWMDVVMIMKSLKSIVQIQDSRSNLATYLKKSIPLLKLFLSKGMPMLNLKLKNDPDYVVEILKTLQLSTRFLHSFFCHTRLNKDTALVAFLPQIKLILEELVYKVRASLKINNCSEAFWMGNLKNKNLQGEVILSQATEVSETEDDDENQLPEDDKSISDSNDNESMKSVSNIY